MPRPWAQNAWETQFNLCTQALAEQLGDSDLRPALAGVSLKHSWCRIDPNGPNGPRDTKELKLGKRSQADSPALDHLDPSSI
jgi:hypothetical protein